MDLNEVNLLGRATRDTELKSTPSGTSVATNSIATGEKFKDKDGNLQETTEFSNLVFWGKVAEIAGEYLTKGKRIFIKGKLKTRTWDDKDTGKKMYRTEIVVREMILLDGGEKTNKNNGKVESDEEFKKRVSEDEITVEDIPF